MERGWQAIVSPHSIPPVSENALIRRTRYVGTEEGILELNVNIQERKMFPKIAVR